MTITVTNFNTHVDQSFIVPVGVTSIAVHIVGASGGSANVTGHPAGWGPLFDGTLAVTPGETLYVQPGQNGGSAGNSSLTGSAAAGYPDGGVGGFGPAFNRGGGGAGSSRIWRSSIGGTLLLLVAGGGGVSGRDGSIANPSLANGGVPIGQATTGGPAATGNGGPGSPFNAGGKGATPSAGGVGGTFGTANGFPGSFMQGGAGRAGGPTTNIRSGGGGGGGLYGGGGGASGTTVFSGGEGGSGGGGSSYIDMAQGWSSTIWDTTQPSEGLTLVGRDGLIRFTYNLPSPGGWSLGLVSRLG